MEIKVTTAEVGDIARLSIVGDKRVSTGAKVAKVVDAEETKTVMFEVESDLVFVDGHKI